MKHILMGAIALSLTPNFFLAADKGGEAGAPEEEPAAATTGPQTASEFLGLHPIVETTYIDIKKIVIDAGTQPRVAIDDATVQEYADIIKSSIKDEQLNPFDDLPDDKLPQVFRDSTGRCVLADGFHRYGGHKTAHAKEMKCAIRDGDANDALVFSLGTNQEHGVRRSNRDKQRAVKIAWSNPAINVWSNSEIARLCGVSEFMVREAKPATVKTTVKQVTIRGKKTTMKTGAIGKGKGGGAKGAKAAAKKGEDKGSDKANAAAKKVEEANDTDLLLKKIAGNCGDAGGKFRAAVNDGSLVISAREVRDLASFDAKMQKRVLPLVTGGLRMKPTKAFDFITSELPEKVLAELENRALADGDKFEHETETLKIVVTRKK